MGEPRRVMAPPVPTSVNDVAAPAANAAATLAYPAAARTRHALSGVAWSYAGSGTLTGGGLTVQDGSATVRSLDITSQGPGFVPFDPPLIGGPEKALTVTLAAGGANVTGKLNALAHWTEAAPPAVTEGYDFSLPANSMYL